MNRAVGRTRAGITGARNGNRPSFAGMHNDAEEGCSRRLVLANAQSARLMIAGKRGG